MTFKKTLTLSLAASVVISTGSFVGTTHAMNLDQYPQTFPAEKVQVEKAVQNVKKTVDPEQAKDPLGEEIAKFTDDSHKNRQFINQGKEQVAEKADDVKAVDVNEQAAEKAGQTEELSGVKRSAENQVNHIQVSKKEDYQAKSLLESFEGWLNHLRAELFPAKAYESE